MSNPKFNLPIQGLRGFAALAVFIFHIYDMARLQGVIPETLPFPAQAALLSLSSGVDLFFMISGYLISASLIRHADIRAFLTDRVLRIYPVFLFLHLLSFTLATLIHYKWLADITPDAWLFHFMSNLFFLPGLFDLPLLQLNAWSLSYEFAFYLFSAAVYFFMKRRRWAGWLLLASLASLFIFLYPRAVFFAVGAMIFFLLRSPYADAAKKLPSLGLFCAPVFFAVTGYAYASEQISFCWPAVVPGFFLFLDIVRGAPLLAGFLSHRIMQFLGKISYSFYLWHPVVTFPLKLIMARILVEKMGASPWLAVPLFGLTALALTVPVSYLSYMWLEQRAKRKLGALLGVPTHRQS